MPHPRKAGSLVTDGDYFYDEDRDIRSESIARNQHRAIKAKYGNQKLVTPGQLNQLKRQRLPETKLFYGGYPEEVKWSKHVDEAEVSPARWTKREIFKEAQRCKTTYHGCQCSWCKESFAEQRILRGKAWHMFEDSPLEDLKAAEEDARLVRREASGEGRLSRSEDSIAWDVHGRRQLAVDDLVAKAALDYERKKESRIQGDWTVLKEGRGSSPRSHQDDWEVLSTTSW